MYNSVGTLIFSIESSCVGANAIVGPFTTVNVNQWYHVVTVVTATPQSSSQAAYIVHVNGALVSPSAITGPLLILSQEAIYGQVRIKSLCLF